MAIVESRFETVFQFSSGELGRTIPFKTLTNVDLYKSSGDTVKTRVHKRI